MATAPLPGRKDDEEDQPGPASGVNPAQGLPASAVAPAPPLLKDTPAAQATGSMQPVGTGFVNIGRYLDANQGIGADVKQRGEGLLRSEGERIGGEVTKAQDKARRVASSNPGSISSSRVLDILGGGSEEDKKSLEKYVAPWSNASEVGPIDYSGKDARSLSGLADARTTGRTINQMNNADAVGGYTPNLEAIDRALYGGVGGAQEATGQLASGSASLRGNANNALFGANQNIREGNAAGAKQIDYNRASMQGSAKQIVDRAGAQAKSAVAAEDLAKTRPNTPDGSTSTWIGGNVGQPSAANFLGTGGQGQLEQISKLLGDPSVSMQAGPDYQAGHWQTSGQPPGVSYGTVGEGRPSTPEELGSGRPRKSESYTPETQGTLEQQAARMGWKLSSDKQYFIKPDGSYASVK